MTDVLLEIRGITKRFGGIVALDDVSFEIRRGEILGLIGPNGAGKSVLINVISGFYRANAGAILFGGSDLTKLADFAPGRLGLARTFQNIRLFRRMTVLENVMVANARHTRNPFRSIFAGRRSENVAEAMDWLARMHLADKADRPAGSLPYGDARRLEIARALATRPKILFLDEPAAGMNEAESATLADDIRKCRTLLEAIVVIEHDVSLLRELSDRMVAMDNGRKIAEGTPAEVFAHAAVIEAYLGTGESDDRPRG